MAGHELFNFRLASIRLLSCIALFIVCMILFYCLLGNGCCWSLFNGVVWLAANLKAMVGDLFIVYFIVFLLRCGTIGIILY
jgi:hypothetical protein